jgi:hypothetical protein
LIKWPDDEMAIRRNKNSLNGQMMKWQFDEIKIDKWQVLI